MYAFSLFCLFVCLFGCFLIGYFSFFFRNKGEILFLVFFVLFFSYLDGMILQFGMFT